MLAALTIVCCPLQAKERAELLVASVQAHSDYTLEVSCGSELVSVK